MHRCVRAVGETDSDRKHAVEFEKVTGQLMQCSADPLIKTRSRMLPFM